MQTVKLYDTTLRDGSQAEHISLTVNDKLRIAQKLNDIGIHYIEGGWPGSNPKDMEFFKRVKRLRLRHSEVAAFGATRRPHIDVAKDNNIRALLKTDCKVITIFGKTWDMHVRDVLKTSMEENIKMIQDSIQYLKSKNRKVFFDAEHFFDGYHHNPDYALQVVLAAQDAGCETVILCDTNGGALTNELSRIVMEVRPKVKVSLGIHCHNDNEMAVANSIDAVLAGCDHVQGTINGYGERCGNANLCSIIPCLKIKLGIDCVDGARLKELTELSRYVAEVCNMKHQDNQPFVGQSAFAHKGGVHVNAILKNPKSYEHIEPHIVGNRRRILISELSGKSSLLIKAEEMEMDLSKESARTRKVLNLLQKLEHQGYHFEAAEGSFELLLKRVMKKHGRFFNLESFRVIIEKTKDGSLRSEATIKLKVKGKLKHTASEGDGPVNALDNALRKALLDFYPKLAKMHLSDFRVRVLDEKGGTAAKVRVLIQSQDDKRSWWTIGVSENIIEASWQALVDSVEYKLLKG